MANKKKKSNKPFISPVLKVFLIILLMPITAGVYMAVYFAWQELKDMPIFEQFAEPTELERIQANFDLEIPVEYIPLYIEAGQKYNVPWTLLATHHRIETRFSTMKSLVSPVGAEGHMQVRP